MQNESAKFKIEFEKRLIRFSLEVIYICAEIRRNRNLWAIADQLIRSATSVGANITEAKGSGSKKDYVRFFEIALKSANETKYWLILAREINPSLQDQLNKLFNEADEIAKIIGAGILTMKGKKQF